MKDIIDLISVQIETGAKHYKRSYILPRLLPKVAIDASDAEILASICTAIEFERSRRNHWSFNQNRLIALHQAEFAERKNLENKQ